LQQHCCINNTVGSTTLLPGQRRAVVGISPDFTRVKKTQPDVPVRNRDRKPTSASGHRVCGTAKNLILTKIWPCLAPSRPASSPGDERLRLAPYADLYWL